MKLTLEEEFLGNSIYRKCTKFGMTYDKAKAQAFEGIKYLRKNPNERAKDIVNKFAVEV